MGSAERLGVRSSPAPPRRGSPRPYHLANPAFPPQTLPSPVVVTPGAEAWRCWLSQGPGWEGGKEGRAGGDGEPAERRGGTCDLATRAAFLAFWSQQEEFNLIPLLATAD